MFEVVVSLKVASQTTFVLLSSDRAWMVKVSTMRLFTIVMSGVIPSGGFRPTNESFTSQLIESAELWRHLNTASCPITTISDEGVIIKPMILLWHTN